MTKKLTGSQLGYRGKGVPDTDTIMELQRSYYESVLERGEVPDAILKKLVRMNELATKVNNGGGSLALQKEISELAIETAPYVHFVVDDVDWDR